MWIRENRNDWNRIWIRNPRSVTSITRFSIFTSNQTVFSPDPDFVPYGTLGRRVTKAPLEFSANPLKHKTGSCLYGTPAARKIPIFGHHTKLAMDNLCVCKLLAAYDINLGKKIETAKKWGIVTKKIGRSIKSVA